MSNFINKVNYDELIQMAKHFHAESDEYVRLNLQTRQRMDALHGGWQGDAAVMFFKEMDDLVLPATHRLSSALLSAETVLVQIMQIIYTADQETASYFNGLEGEPNIAKKKNLIVLNYGIDYQNDDELNQLKDQLIARYGKDTEVVILDRHPFDTRLQRLDPLLSFVISSSFGAFAPVASYFAPGLADGVLSAGNKAIGLSQTIFEYTFGWGTESDKVYHGIKEKLMNNPLIDPNDVNVVLGGQSGSGVTDANVARVLQNEGIHVSLVNMGSPFSNFDQLKPGTTIVDIINQNDDYGRSLGLGTLRSDEMRYGVVLAAPLIVADLVRDPFSTPSSLQKLYTLDGYYRNPGLNIQNVTVPGGTMDRDIAHNSYFHDDSNIVVDAYNKALLH